MKCKAANSNALVLILSAVAFAAIIVVFVQTNSNGTTGKSFNRLPVSSSSSSLWASSNSNHNTDHTMTTTTTPSNGSSHPISKAEEKWSRWMKNLHDAENEVIHYNQLRITKNQTDEQHLTKLETDLANARAYVKKPNHHHKIPNNPDPLIYIPTGSLYKDASAFHRSYIAMEKTFKIYIYEEGEPPIFHTGPCSNIYSTEGFFINFLEKNTKFRTREPDKAHVFFLPYSVAMIIQHLFDPIVRDKAVLERIVLDYIHLVSNNYPYWNRSVGVDHFMLSCHDWGPRSTWYHPILYFKSIRALCNANTSENFNPTKDLSIPEINFISDELTKPTPNPHSNKTILAFFAGRLNGRIRPLLLNQWKEKDPDLQIYEQLPADGISYHDRMKSSKYCICPSGWEVASPRVVEAIYAGCVPVLISQAYILPFSDVLDWKSFSVSVPVEEIGGLKETLMRIPDEEYVKLYRNVIRVQKHFQVNDPPKRYDVFHMILHSVWLRRLNVRVGS